MDDPRTAVQPIAARKTPAEHDAINSETAFRFIRAIAVEKAVLDQSLDPSCIRVLAAISYFMHSETRRAWPSYERLSEITGYCFDRIERAIKRLKAKGYIFSERRSPITGGRALVHYGLNGIRPRDIDDMVTAAILAMRANATDTHPGRKSGVTSPRRKERGDYSDPGVFTASDPGVFADSNPIRKEPSSKGRDGQPNPVIAEPPLADADAPLKDLTIFSESEEAASAAALQQGAEHLWRELQAECFPFPPKFEAAASWKKAAAAEPKIASLSPNFAKTIARQAKVVLSETSRNGKAEWPGVGEIVRQISNHESRVLQAREAHKNSVADWDTKAARIAKLDRDEEAVQAIYDLHPLRPIKWPRSREDIAADEAAVLARKNAILAQGLSERTRDDPKYGEATPKRPTLCLPEFSWQRPSASTGFLRQFSDELKARSR